MSQIEALLLGVAISVSAIGSFVLSWRLVKDAEQWKTLVLAGLFAVAALPSLLCGVYIGLMAFGNN